MPGEEIVNRGSQERGARMGKDGGRLAGECAFRKNHDAAKWVFASRDDEPGRGVLSRIRSE